MRAHDWIYGVGFVFGLASAACGDDSGDGAKATGSGGSGGQIGKGGSGANSGTGGKTTSGGTGGGGGAATGGEAGAATGGSASSPSGGAAGSATGGSAGTASGGSAGSAGGGGGVSGLGGVGGGGSNLTPIFRMNCENSPLECGWGGPPVANQYYSATHLEDAGPYGQDVVRFTQTPQPASTGQVQYYLGWGGGGVVGSPPPQGATRYIRLWFRPIAPLVFNGTGDVWGDKFIILGDGGGSGGRMICNVRDGYPTDITRMGLGCYRNIDGGDHGTGVLLANDQWNHVQIEVRSSTTTSSTDARITMWLNNNAYSSPTGQSTGAFSLNTSGWNNMGVGRYAGTALASDGQIVFDVGGVEYDDEFDPNWYPGP